MKRFQEYSEGHPANDDGNKNINAFTNALSGDKTVEDKIKIATCNADSVALGADAEKKDCYSAKLEEFRWIAAPPRQQDCGPCGDGC